LVIVPVMRLVAAESPSRVTSLTTARVVLLDLRANVMPLLEIELDHSLPSLTATNRNG
jgi:hypothetical protein